MKINPQHIISYSTGLDASIGQRVITENTESARSWFETWPDVKFVGLEWPAYAWPGGYEIHYLTHTCDVLCHQCANDNLALTIDPDLHDWYITEGDSHWEGPPLYCDHCRREIKAVYGDPDAEEEEGC